MKIKEFLTIGITNRVIFTIEKMIKLNSTVKGLENITQNSSIIFTPNHFTRSETFIIPYILNQTPNLKFCRSLAFSSLFTSYLGKYLTNLKALSTSALNRDDTIVESIASGESNWVIYPEGMMVKDRKREITHGIFETKLSIKTGASVVAIKAEMLQKKIFEEENVDGDVDGVYKTIKNPVCIIPVTISYTPIHPDKENKILKLAKKFAKTLPRRLEEEFIVEGSLLLNSRITLEIHKPIKIKEYTEKPSHLFDIFGIENEKTLEYNISKYRMPISTKIAYEIYQHAYITYEHIVCAILNENKHIKIDLIPYYIICCVQNLKQYSNIQRYEDGLRDEDILKHITNDLKIKKIISLLEHQCCIKIEGNFIYVLEKFHTYENFDDVRIENISKIFINELYFFKNIKSLIKSSTALDSFKLMKKCLTYLDEIYLRKHELTKSPHSIEAQYGMAKFVTKSLLTQSVVSNKNATLFIHGYKASPAEMLKIAQEYTNNTGSSSYCVRMEGHGTSPFDMATTTRFQWEESCDISYKILSIHFERIDVCGFSTGGLIALKLANKYESIKSIITINPALKLCDIRFNFVKFAKALNGSLEKLLKSGKSYIIDKPYFPKTNYAINHFSSMAELSNLMSETAKILPNIKCNALIIYSSDDPVVAPQSSIIIYKSIKSHTKSLEEIHSSEHVIVRGNLMKKVSKSIESFLIANK